MLLDHGIHHDIAMEVIRFARDRDLHIQAYRDDQLLVERDRPEAREYSRHAGMPINVVADLDQAIGATTPKLVIVSSSVTLEELLPDVRSRWAGRLNAATSMPTYLEFTSIESDKATALQFLCARMGAGRGAHQRAGERLANPGSRPRRDPRLSRLRHGQNRRQRRPEVVSPSAAAGRRREADRDPAGGETRSRGYVCRGWDIRPPGPYQGPPSHHRGPRRPSALERTVDSAEAVLH